MSDFERVIKIRPHHGMCIQFFCGEGYSAEFVSGMSGVISRLEMGAQIELTDGTDSICKFCPNNICGECTSYERVSRFDSAVLEFCGLYVGSVLDWREFSGIVCRKIIESGKMKSVCGDCQWADICFSNN